MKSCCEIANEWAIETLSEYGEEYVQAYENCDMSGDTAEEIYEWVCVILGFELDWQPLQVLLVEAEDYQTR